MKALLTATEIGMIAYWVFAALAVAGLIHVAPELMYSDYENPMVVAWNWSFFPVDILFAVTGLIARFGTLSARSTETLEIFSLTLMFCAGLMAISYWVFQQGNRMRFMPQ